jgi:hypothetical protein
MSESDDTTTIPTPDNEEDELIFLDGKKRRKYIDEVKEAAERVRKNPR